jgi:Galactose oxidase, central domain
MRWRIYDSQRSTFCLCLSLILMALAVTDLRAQSFVPAGTMTRPRDGNSATLLQDGRVLIAGGEGELAAPSAEIYDPVSSTFAETGALIQKRSFHAAVLLGDGRVLLVGGCQPCAAMAELYNPKNGRFTRTGDMSVAQVVYSGVLLKNGKVL